MKVNKRFIILFILLFVITLSACNSETDVSDDNRNIILKNDYTNKTRNELLIEDVEYFRKQLTDKHKNAFHNITKKEFNVNVDLLISKVEELTNKQVFVEMNKITASLGDAHTGMNYWDGYSYPLKFYCLNDGIFVIDTDKSLEDILYAKVKKINGIDINIITEELKTLISHENENWVKSYLPNYLSSPVFMYGLDIIPNEEKTAFEFQTIDGDIIIKEIDIFSYGEYPDFINLNSGRNVYLFNKEKEDYYWYKYLEEDKAVYFKYNVCEIMKDNLFLNFNYKMFNSIKDYEIDKFIIDLRHNSGGNSSVINPFLKSITDLASASPEMKIYVITGRATFSSGVMAVLDIKNEVPITLIGESTGGSPNSYGDVGIFELPNSKIPIQYSKRYFQLTSDGAITITPDITIEPSINDFKENKDVVMEYILKK